MKFEVLYVIASLIIAICIWIEAVMLDRNLGKLPQQGMFAVISLSTSLWLLVSAAALYFLDFDKFAISVPVVYMIYSVAGWIYGAKLINHDDISNDIEQLIIPKQYLIFSKSFALVFAFLCIFVLIIPYFI